MEGKKSAIDAQIAELRQMMTGGAAPTASTPQTRARRKMSAAVRKRMAEAQRKRWAAVKEDSVSQGNAAPMTKAKRHLSPEGRRRTIEATKKRWAAIWKAQAKAAK